jgi:hypothetical protein
MGRLSTVFNGEKLDKAIRKDDVSTFNRLSTVFNLRVICKYQCSEYVSTFNRLSTVFNKFRVAIYFLLDNSLNI